MEVPIMVRCFLAAARLGTFTAAAEELYMTRQAVSKQILRLEESLGAELFYRKTKQVELTHAGRLYLTFFQEEIERYHRVVQQVEALSAPTDGLRVGFLSGIEIGEMLYDMVSRLHHRLPPIQWRRGNPMDLIQDVRSGNLDIAITFTDDQTRSTEGIAVTPIGMVRMVVAASRENPRVASAVSAKDLETETFYSWTKHPEDQAREKEDVIRHGRHLGLEISRVELLESQDTVQTVMKMGNGAALCTELDSICSHPRIVTFPLEARIELGCVYRQGAGREVRDFVRQAEGLPLTRA